MKNSFNDDFNKSNTLGKMIFKLFNKQPNVKKGQKGIYQYSIHMDAMTEHHHSHKYVISAKVIAKNVYNGLVEIELEDVTVENLNIFEDPTDKKMEIVTKNLPRFINPKFIKWELL